MHGAMRLRCRGLFTMLGLLSACSQSHDGDSDIAARSGSRLRLRWLESEGVRVVLGLHDTQLGTDCTVRKAEDGELYCFPGAPQTKVFVDALCSQLAATTNSCTPAPTMLATVSRPGVLGTSSSCVFVELYAVQAPEPLASYFAQFPTASCVENPAGPHEGFLAQRLTARVPESALVHVTEVATTGKELVQNRYFAGDDGSYLPAGFVDTRFGACEPGVAGDGRIRCLPRSDVDTVPGMFSDSACSTPVAIGLPACNAPEPKLVGSNEPNTNGSGCRSSTRRLFELGEPVAKAFSGSPCGEVNFGTQTLAHRVGKELAPETFPLLDAVPVGSGRLRLQGWSAHGLEPIFGLATPLTFTDAQLSLSCSAATTNDGALRCVPAVSGFAHADATCSRPYVSSTCVMQPAPRFARRESDPCHVAVHAVAREPETLATPFAQSGARCIRLGEGAASGFALQEVVDPAMFATMSERVE